MEKDEQIEVLHIRNAQRDKKESADRTNHSVWYNKTTRDSLSKTSAFYSPDQTTGNYDNFTNVTASNFETTENWCGEKTAVTGGDDMDLGNDSDKEVEEEEEEEQKASSEVKLKNFSGKLAKLAQDESVASRTMPPQPQEPSSLGLCVTLNNTNNSNNQNNTRTLLEPESMSSKFDNFKYFNESNLNDESKSACNDYQFNNNQGHFKVPMVKFCAPDFNNTTCTQESDVNALFIFILIGKE